MNEQFKILWGFVIFFFTEMSIWLLARS